MINYFIILIFNVKQKLRGQNWPGVTSDGLDVYDVANAAIVYAGDQLEKYP